MGFRRYYRKIARPTPAQVLAALPAGMGTASAFPTSTEEQYPLKKVLLCAATEIAVFGWAPASPRYGITSAPLPTKDRVLAHFTADDGRKKVLRQQLLNGAKSKGIDLFSEDFVKAVDAAIEWAKNLQGTSEYDLTIRALCYRETISGREFGFAVSILNAYGKHVKRVVSSNSQHIGQVGEKIELTMVLAQQPAKSSNTFPNMVVVRGVQEGTENIVFFWSDSGWSLPAGSKLRVRGRIRLHMEWQGVKQTKLHYVKFEVI